jgi:hypothetical protein
LEKGRGKAAGWIEGKWLKWLKWLKNHESGVRSECGSAQIIKRCLMEINGITVAALHHSM